jgi:signal transduction histidine kinase
LRHRRPVPASAITAEAGTGHRQVVNTGRLVTQAEERQLFEPFVRGAANGVRGAGLGLSIATRPTGGMDIAIHLPQTPEAPTSG